MAGVAGQLLAHMLAVRMADTAQRMLQPSLMPMPQRLPGLECQAGVRHSHGPRDGQGPCAGVDLPGSGHFCLAIGGFGRLGRLLGRFDWRTPMLFFQRRPAAAAFCALHPIPNRLWPTLAEVLNRF
ncbi:hypothetical protein CK621_00905 [Vandammella animalimorsus]|uniref:Uncharacterized protein n=1 Tax=Vandammella animalimorsus TaxID=2029117 RepID=A0A2A2B299_9BURK|nr:hypothetical protein CK621_00905 [Vandammella animalimorsus]